MRTTGVAAVEADAAAIDQEFGTCGGMSFTSDTKVVLASGASISIAKLKPGDKVLAANTTTGKTQAETVGTVLVHRDTDLYDLKITAGKRTAIIATTSSHLFWVPGTGGQGGRWVKAEALHYGSHLRTPGGGYAIVIGSWTPLVNTGWMWNLAIPGDHDFYIQAATAGVLVHNCPTEGSSNWLSQVRAQAARSAANRDAGAAARDAIAAMYSGSQTEVAFDTDLGSRIVDVLTAENRAIESKVGYTTLSSTIESQIAKDQLLMQTGQVSGVEWVFSPNAYGEAGLSGPLGDALDQAGILWQIRSP